LKKTLNRNRGDIWDKCLERIRDYDNAAQEPLQTRQALQATAVKAIAELAIESACSGLLRNDERRSGANLVARYFLP
jgi:hypothetical protein